MSRNIKQRLKKGDVIVGGMITHFLRPAMIKMYGQLGFDFIYIENEHAMHNPENLVDCVGKASDNDLAVVIKPPYLDRGETARLLDAGVMGIQLPQSETREQIEEFSSWVKYPPLGMRMVSCASGLSEYRNLTLADLERLNDETCVIAHIETRKAVENIEAISACPLVDIIFIGQLDLSVSLGKPYDFECKEQVEAVQTVIEAALAAGKIAGIYAIDAVNAGKYIKQGVTFIETADEISFIRSGAKALMDDFRKLAK